MHDRQRVSQRSERIEQPPVCHAPRFTMLLLLLAAPLRSLLGLLTHSFSALRAVCATRYESSDNQWYQTLGTALVQASPCRFPLPPRRTDDEVQEILPYQRITRLVKLCCTQMPFQSPILPPEQPRPARWQLLRWPFSLPGSKSVTAVLQTLLSEAGWHVAADNGPDGKRCDWREDVWS